MRERVIETLKSNEMLHHKHNANDAVQYCDGYHEFNMSALFKFNSRQ